MTAWNGQTWLITGGAGFIGSNLVHHLVMAGYRVVNLDALTYAGNPASLRGLPAERHELVEGEIGNAKLVRELLDKYKPQALLNLAAESHVDRSIDSPAAFVDTNVGQTVQLLESVLAWWRDTEAAVSDTFRFLHVSTDEVYGSIDQGQFTEESAFTPNSPYAASKAASDHFVRAFHVTYGLPAIISNCSNNYGPMQFPEKLIPHMIVSALEGRPLPIYGDGLNIRDWLYVEDHCKALEMIAIAGKPGETYNIGGEAEVANRDVVERICSALDRLVRRKDGRSYKSQVRFVADRPGHDRRYAVDCEKLKSELGWSQSVNFEEGLEKTIYWYLNNRDWWQPLRDRKYSGDRLGTRRK